MAGQAQIAAHNALAFDDLTDCSVNLARYVGLAAGGTNFTADVAGTVPVTITGAASQTGDLLDIKNSTGTVLFKVDSAGNVTAASVSGAALKTATVAASAAIANTDTKISVSQTLVVSSTLIAASVMRWTIQGTCTSTNADTQIYTLRAGTAGTVADTGFATFSIASAGSGTAVPFSIVITYVVRVPGASGTGAGSLVLNNTGNTGIFADRSTVIPSTTSTLATTTATKLTLSYISGAATTATTFQDVVTEVIT